MTLGPGKYDDLCSLVLERAGIVVEHGLIAGQGGAIVIIINGNKGTGFSCQADLETTNALADILEGVAKKIRAKGPFIP